MLESKKKPTSWTIGFAVFSMFFGAGNIIFPLALGAFAQDKHPIAILGLVLTAICVPFGGLVTMMFWGGDYEAFFGRMGKKVGFGLSFLILLLMGPVGALPRCITTSYATISVSFPQLPLLVFSLISCIIIFLFSRKSRNVIKLLGLFLTPLLLAALVTIIIKGWFVGASPKPSPASSLDIFLNGLLTGYNTMDLLASFFFSSVVIMAVKKNEDVPQTMSSKKLLRLMVKATVIGACLLAFIYIGFTTISASYGYLLQGVTQDALLGTIASHLLGPSAGLFVAIAVFLACLTTEIALAVVFSEFLHLYIFRCKVSYRNCLLLTLFVSFLISTLRFQGIAAFLVPIIQICYPALIMLTLLNACHKFWGFKPLKVPVYATFFVSLIAYLWF